MTFLIALVVAGVVFALLKKFVGIAEPFNTIIIVVVVLFFCLWLLDITGVHHFAFMRSLR
jgi:hypothetical protein